VRARGVSARMCIPERASSARVGGTHPPVSRRVLNAGCLAFFGLLCLTWCVLWCPRPPPRCAQIAAPSCAGPFRAPAVAAASPQMGMMQAPIFRYGRVHVHICMYISMYVSETFFIYVHVVDVSISICVRVGPQDACLLCPKKHGAAADCRPAWPSTCLTGFGSACYNTHSCCDVLPLALITVGVRLHLALTCVGVEYMAARSLSRARFPCSLSRACMVARQCLKACGGGWVPWCV